VDSAVTEGDRVNGDFDSMIAKLVVWAPNRAQAVARLAQALQDFIILGCRTNLPFLQAIARSEDFLAGMESTAWIGEHLKALNAPLLSPGFQDFFTSRAFREALSCAFQGLGAPAPGPAERFAAQRHGELAIGSALEQDGIRILPGPEPHRFTVTGPALGRILGAAHTGPSVAFAACRLGGSTMAVAVLGDTLQLEDPLASLPATRAASSSGAVLAPMGGRIVEVRVALGDAVEEGQLLFVLESMKMQFEILAPRAGRVLTLSVAAGQILPGPETLAVVG
jgi:acetyl/propionyl-CoA carboxylase alpha subunit